MSADCCPQFCHAGCPKSSISRGGLTGENHESILHKTVACFVDDTFRMPEPCCGCQTGKRAGKTMLRPLKKPLAPGSRVTAMLRVQNAPSDVRAMGYEIWFNPAALKFEKFERQGEMKNRFAMLGGNVVKPGKLRMGGIEPQTGTPLESGTTGDLFVLQFSVIGQGSPDFRFMNLKDDIRGLAVQGFLMRPGCRFFRLAAVREIIGLVRKKFILPAQALKAW